MRNKHPVIVKASYKRCAKIARDINTHYSNRVYLTDWENNFLSKMILYRDEDYDGCILRTVKQCDVLDKIVLKLFSAKYLSGEKNNK